jgi:hypothetical protein
MVINHTRTEWPSTLNCVSASATAWHEREVAMLVALVMGPKGRGSKGNGTKQGQASKG